MAYFRLPIPIPTPAPVRINIEGLIGGTEVLWWSRSSVVIQKFCGDPDQKFCGDPDQKFCGDTDQSVPKR